MQGPRREWSASGRWPGLAVILGVFLGGAASFLPRQCLWLDEATQLTGLGLGPAGVTRWLAGGGPGDTGQFRDRMPPLSYWMGWAWGSVFGFGEASLRWFGVACVAAAAALVYESARRAFGTASAWVAGLSFALCPAVIVLAVEIRAYPVFLLWSACAVYSLVCLHAAPPDERPRTYAALALALSAAVSTHYFGAVLAGSILAALVLLACRGRGRLWPVMGVGAVFAATLAALLPLVLASIANSRRAVAPGVGPAARLDGIKNLAVRLVNHAALSVHRPASIVAVAAAAVLIVLAVGVARSSRRPGVAVALSLGMGLLVVTAAKLALNRFDPASSNYNAWMRPGFCVLLSAGIASRSRHLRRAAAVASVLLLASQATAVYALAAHGEHFAHGPHRTIVELIRTLDPRDVAVVHDDPSHRYVFVYCPIRSEFGPGLAHYQGIPGAGGTVKACGHAAGRVAGPVVALPHRYLMVIRSETTSAADLAAQVRAGDRPLRDGPLAQVLRASGGWRVVAERVAVASISAKIDVFESQQPRMARRKADVGAAPPETRTY